MEVARSGVFHPQMFTFAEVMLLFLAVMFTNVILLDLFNTLGMPTSTTVSLVFGLLGAAVGICVFKLSNGSVVTMPDGDPASMAEHDQHGQCDGDHRWNPDLGGDRFTDVRNGRHVRYPAYLLFPATRRSCAPSARYGAGSR